MHSRLHKLATVARVFLEGLPHRREAPSYAQQQHNRYGQNHDNWSPDSELLLPAQPGIDADEKSFFVQPGIPAFARFADERGYTLQYLEGKDNIRTITCIVLPRAPLVAGLLVSQQVETTSMYVE